MSAAEPIGREELYALVWSAPGKDVAKRLGCSDVYLRRVCLALDVPRPGRGWWAKRAVGIAGPPPPLPDSTYGRPDYWIKGGSGTAVRRWKRYTEIQSAAADSGRHPLVHLAAHIFLEAQMSADGTHLVTYQRDAIDLTTSAETLEDALSLADNLFTLLEVRGHRVNVAAGAGFIRPLLHNRAEPASQGIGAPPALWCPTAPTVAIVSGVPIGLAIIEPIKEALMRYIGDGKYVLASTVRTVDGITWTERRMIPSRRLKVIAYSPHFPAPWQREWSETRRNTLQREVGAIVSELEGVAQTLPHAEYFLPTE